MRVRMAKKKRWDKCSADEIAWLGLDVKMKDFTEVSDWLEALARSGGCGFGEGEAFGGSTNSLATWIASLADKIREQVVYGFWINGKNYEYEFAYCSRCGHMEHAGWDSHKEAREKIGEFYKEYQYCPNCGAKMEGGGYVD